MSWALSLMWLCFDFMRWVRGRGEERSIIEGIVVLVVVGLGWAENSSGGLEVWATRPAPSCGHGHWQGSTYYVVRCLYCFSILNARNQCKLPRTAPRWTSSHVALLVAVPAGELLISSGLSYFGYLITTIYNLIRYVHNEAYLPTLTSFWYHSGFISRKSLL